MHDGEALSPFLLLNIILKPWALYVKQTEDDSKMKRRYGLESSEPRRENVVSFLGFRFASCTLDVERNKSATWKRQRAQKKSTLFPVSQKPGKRQPRKTKLLGNNCSTPAEPPPREELWPHLHPSHRKQRGELRLPPSPTCHRAGVKENQVGSGDFSPVRW